MIAVTVPTTDVNSETIEIVAWLASDRGAVHASDPLAEVETSKAILDIAAPAGGVVLCAAEVGERVPISAPIAYIFDTLEELERHASERVPPLGSGGGEERVSVPARRRAAELGVELDALLRSTAGLVTVALVEAAVAPALTGALPDPLPAPPGVARIALLGGGAGATQVLEIMRGETDRLAVAIVDEDSAKWGATIAGLPVIGGLERLLELHGAQALDGVIIAVSTSVDARARLRAACQGAGLPLERAIDPSARIAADAQVGAGNVICAFCHIGAGTVVGENNFLSAYNSFDHHNVLGSDSSTGPGCMTSGLVRIGDRCRLGTGVHIEPHVELGDDVQVASGATILASVPARHAVKTRQLTTTVVPRRDA